MAKNKYDAVLEAMRVDENGQLELARIYERKGVIFSDYFLVDREQLIQRLKSGQKILTGKRQYKMGSVFDTGDEVKVITSNEKDVLVVGSESSSQDQLNSVPRF